MNWPKIYVATFAVTILLHPSVLGGEISQGFSDARLFSVGGRVIGGRDAFLGEFPYQLQLRYDNDLVCGATLVDNAGQQMVITAAHCVTDDVTDKVNPPDLYELRGGVIGAEETGQALAVQNIVVHPNYNSTPEGIPLNDIAVMFPSGEFTYDDNVKPLSLPIQDQATTGQVVLTGWGRTKVRSREGAQTLQAAELPVVDSDTCNTWYVKGRDIQIIYDTMLCAGFENAEKAGCNGDSGGPAAGEENGELYLAGVVSFGSRGCARYPTVFTRVSSFVDWISGVTP